MSEHSLDGLIATVKAEAIEASKKEAKLIIDKAKQDAKHIVSQAETEMATRIEDAKNTSDTLIKKGELALHQAARDVQISIKNDLQRLFKLILTGEVKDAFTPELYSSLIIKVVDSLGDNTTIALPEATKDELINAIRKAVVSSDSTVEIIKKEGLLSGLSVTKTNEGWSYDITSEEVSDLMSQHLNQKWVEILNSSK